nr:putative 8kDa protein [Fig virus B]
MVCDTIPFLIVLFLVSLIIICSIHPSFQKQSSSGVSAKDLMHYFKKEEYIRKASLYASLSDFEYTRPKLGRVKNEKDRSN